MSAGKGDKLRKGADLEKFRSNYDNIFKTKKDERRIQTRDKTTIKTKPTRLGK
jgi:hypothetical protein